MRVHIMSGCEFACMCCLCVCARKSEWVCVCAQCLAVLAGGGTRMFAL